MKAVYTYLLTLFVLSLSPANFAQSDSETLSCSWACASNDRVGKSLILGQSDVPPFTSPYSIFNCVYSFNDVHQPCRYYKTSGEFALGASTSDCPASAVQSCVAAGTSVTSPAQAAEVMPWVERGGSLLWVIGHPYTKRDVSPASSIYSIMCA